MLDMGDIGGGGGATEPHANPNPRLNDIPPLSPPNTLQTPPILPNLPPLAFRYPFLCVRSFSRRISAFLPAMTVDTDSEAPAKKRKLLGREFYESIGSPTTIVAPMVEQSEYVCGPLAVTSPCTPY